MMINKIFLKGIKVKTIIGIKKIERNNKQTILINCIINSIYSKSMKDEIDNTINYKHILKEIRQFAKKSRYYLIETLSCELTNYLLNHFKIKNISIKIEKIEVLKDIKKVGVIIERNI